MPNHYSQTEHPPGEVPAARGLVKAAVLIVLGAGFGWAQVATETTPRSGIWIGNLSVYSYYHSTGLVRAVSTIAPFGLRSDVMIGGSGTVHALRLRERDRFGITYTPSYTARTRYSEWNSLNQSLSLNYERSLAPRFRLGLSASGHMHTFEDFQFSDTSLSSLATRPGTANDLAGAVGGRGDPGLVVPVGPGADSAIEFLLYGGRVLTSSFESRLSYSVSPRFSTFFSFHLDRTQHMSSGRGDEGVYRLTAPQTTAGSGAIGVTYSLSPRTNMSVQASSTRNSTRLRSYYLTTAGASVDRMISPRWFVNGTASLGTVTAGGIAERPSRPLQILGGGGLGYRYSSQTWLASYDRRIGDAYGVGTSGAHTAGITWRWAQPMSGWGVSISGNRFQLSGHPRLETWRGVATVGRHLTSSTALLFEYAYTRYKHDLAGSLVTVNQQAARVAFMWSSLRSRTP